MNKSDLEKVQDEISKRLVLSEERILGATAKQLAASLTGRTKQIILDDMSAACANIQKAASVATAEREEAEKQARLFEERLVRLKQEIKELSDAHREKKTALDALTAEYDALVPVVAELRKEHQSHVDAVKKLVG